VGVAVGVGVGVGGGVGVAAGGGGVGVGVGDGGEGGVTPGTAVSTTNESRSTRGCPGVPATRISTVRFLEVVQVLLKTISRAAVLVLYVSTLPAKTPLTYTLAAPRTGLLADTHANVLPVNVKRAMAPTVRVDRALRPSYEGDVVRLQVPLTNVSARVVSGATARRSVPVVRHAPTLPAASMARTWNW
jgi:hypothetical protein